MVECEPALTGHRTLGDTVSKLTRILATAVPFALALALIVGDLSRKYDISGYRW